ncbi:MAG: SpoIIE family protein phosphatase, partial [Phaeodactylibacter sp.]|nr:SpoIIE family protein phosphatase [Phaeodactylibacter sp.]
SNPCDWKASEISCQGFMEAFEQNATLGPAERFSEALHAVNRQILLVTDACQGMKSTFCGIVWDFANRKVYYANIGDSRIYEWSDHQIHQISTDEVKSVILKKKDGKPMILSGIAVVAEGVTNVIGSEDLQFEVKTKSAEHIRGFVLSTDGFHGITPDFENDLLKSLNALDLEGSLEQLYLNYQDGQKDDMTILAVRTNDPPANYPDIISALLHNGDTPQYSFLEQSAALLLALKDGIKDRDTPKVNQLLAVVEAKKIDFGRDRYGELIALMHQADFQDGAIYRALLLKMRESKIYSV